MSATPVSSANVSPKTPTKAFQKNETFQMLFDLQRKFNSKQQFLPHHLCFRRGNMASQHNKPADIDSGLVNGQCFDSRLPCANSKLILNLSKAGFSKLFVPGRERQRDQRIVRLRAEKAYLL